MAAAPKITEYLIPSESHAIEVRHHWAYLGTPIVATVAFWIGGLIALSLSLEVPILRAACVFFLLFSLLWLAWHATEWWFERFVVTDRRVLLLTGVYAKKVAVMPLAKVTDLTYERSVPGRLLGYGSFVIESAGQQQALRRIRYLPEPLALYHEVSALLFGSRSARDDGTGLDPITGMPAPAYGDPMGMPAPAYGDPMGMAAPAYGEGAADPTTALWPADGDAGRRADLPTAPLPGVRG